ncbi:condensation domain-containing protein [Curtobacterium sp. PhB146]|uniref:condensation domain-containing protein n=1 Tax=Curtobacterium sp. PhB146 TaxID=2485187 RepID=UPI00104E948A|nr:condensation domain-containing protein [Curtobacterium sp. PhB146]TCU50259.1 amino acid adenylation domain-containing protein [Curtobacterium sp. PhB146]
MWTLATPQEENIWTADKLATGGSGYNIPYAWRILGSFDAGRLREAYGRALLSFPALTSVYGLRGTALMKENRSWLAPVFVWADSEDIEHVNLEISAEVSAPFLLESAPPIRAKVFALSPGDHVFSVTIHHIACDADSARQFFAFLSAEYNRIDAVPVDERAAVGSGAVGPPGSALQTQPVALSTPLGDGASRSAASEPPDRRSSAEDEEGLIYWTEHLAGASTVSFAGFGSELSDPSSSFLEWSPTEARWQDMRELCNSAAVSPFMFWFSAYAIAIHKMLSVDDFTVAYPVSLREVNDPIDGVNVNTLLARFTFTPDTLLKDVLRHTRAELLTGAEYKRVAYAHLVAQERRGALPGQWGESGALFTAMFSHASVPPLLKLKGCDSAPVAVVNSEPMCPMRLEVLQTAGSDVPTLQLSFRQSSLRDVEAQTFLRLLRTVADALVNNLELSIEDSVVIEERAATQWGRLEDLGSENLIAAVRSAADLRPDSIAISHQGLSVRYKDLVRRIDQARHHFRMAGLERGAVVSLSSGRSVDLIAIVLAAIESSITFCLLDPDGPAEKNSNALDRLDPDLCLVEKSSMRFPHSYTAWTIEEFLAGRVQHRSSALHESGPRRGPGRDTDVAYVVFTSGTTGTPKAIAVPSAGLRNHVNWATRFHGLTTHDVVGFKTNPSFDAALWEFIAPLRVGGEVAVLPARREKVPDYVAQWLSESRVTVLQVVPSFLRRLLDEPGFKLCRTLRLVTSAGEALPEDYSAETKRLVQAEVTNTYGPSETSVDVAAFATRADTEHPARVVPLGLPIDNTGLVAVDRRGRPVAQGVPGELRVLGAGVANGYLGMPAETEKRFLSESGERRQRAYMTGDIVRFIEGEGFHFLGRADSEVKVNGVRIDLGNIEQIIMRHPSVSAARVVAVSNEGSPSALRAYVSGDAHLTSLDVRELLVRHLPQASMPQTVVVLDHLPVNANGKLDLEALARWSEKENSETTILANEPRFAAELASAWEAVLGEKPETGADHFFESGGDSIAAFALSSCLASVYELQLDAREVYTRPRFRDLTASIRPPAQRPSSKPTQVGPSPASTAELEMWLGDQLHDEPGAYSIPAVFWVATLDFDRFGECMLRLIQMHDALRTKYTFDGQMLLRNVTEVSSFVPSRSSSAAMPTDDELRAELTRPFDLDRELPIRCHLYEVSGNGVLITFVFHHIVADAQSLDIFLTQLEASYDGLESETPPGQFSEYVVDTIDSAGSAQRQADFEFWREYIREHRSGEARTDSVDWERAESSTPRRSMEKSQNLGVQTAVKLSAVETLAKRTRTSVFVVLLAAVARGAQLHGSASAFTIGVIDSGRNGDRYRNAVGCFVNTLPLVGLVGDLSRPDSLIQRANDQLGKILLHSRVTLSEIAQMVREPRGGGQLPLIDLLVAPEMESSTTRVLFGNEQRAVYESWPSKAVATLVIEQSTRSDRISFRFGSEAQELASAEFIRTIVDVLDEWCE